MTQFAFTPQNFYDPGISIYMGIRHLMHFHNQAIAAGFTGIELLRHTLIGYNTGWVTTSDSNWLVQYSDEIGSLAGWYLNNGHLYDTIFTWTGEDSVVEMPTLGLALSYSRSTYRAHFVRRTSGCTRFAEHPLFKALDYI